MGEGHSKVFEGMGRGIPVSVQSFFDYFQRNPRLRLHSPQSVRRDVFLQERLNSGV